MNFFEAQSGARRNTAWLVALFVMGVAALVAMTSVLVLATVHFSADAEGFHAPFLKPALVLPVALGVLLVIGVASLLKIRELAAGGRVVAEALGGRPLLRSGRNPDEARALNVVEEMALAAGLPVPAVYLLEEPGINAFAAGWTPRDAVIGLTLGAVTRLERDELQGLAAHEFSHILNQDMARNMQLTGVLHGILILGQLGRSLGGSDENRLGRRRGFSLYPLALGLMILGYGGSFFGRIIKSLISRQREFLADASAVQFTRQPTGILNALKKIGGGGAGSRLHSAHAEVYSHFYFAEGLRSTLFATHPPLADRIRRLEAHWDGQWLQAAPPPRLDPPVPVLRPRQAVRSLGVSTALQVLEEAGLVDTRSLGYARGLLGRLPAPQAGESCDPLGAQALVLALTLSELPATRAVQEQILRRAPWPGLAERFDKVKAAATTMEPELRLPLIDLAMATLRGLSRPQYEAFRGLVMELMLVDGQLDLGEWLLQRVVLFKLDGAHGLRTRVPVRRGGLSAASGAVRLLMGTLARLEHPDGEAARAFAEGCGRAGLPELDLPADGAPAAADLESAMNHMAALERPARLQLMRGLIACAGVDGHITARGLELMRALAINLDLPMPIFAAAGTWEES